MKKAAEEHCVTRNYFRLWPKSVEMGPIDGKWTQMGLFHVDTAGHASYIIFNDRIDI